MWRNRFDTKLIGVLSVMAMLAVMVSAVAIGVNSYLVRNHKTLAARNVPALELAARALTEAEYFGSLAAGFVEADTQTSLAELTATLLQSLSSLETDLAALDALRSQAGAAPQTQPPGDQPTRDAQVRDLSAKAAEVLRLDAQIAARAARIAEVGEQMMALTEAEGDLARLRMTAGITDLYDRPDTDLRTRLDTMADRHFFAYDRLTELVHTAERINLELQHVTGLSAHSDINALRQRLDEALALVDRRIPYLPTVLGQSAARRFAGLQRAELGAGGLLDLRARQITLISQIGTGQLALRADVAALAERARQASDAVQRASMAEIARTDLVAHRLTMGFLLLVLLVVLAEGAVWLYARRELVSRLADVSRNIVSVARGNYDTPIAISGHDEIGRMEKSLNILRRRAGEGARLRGHLEEAVMARTADVVREMDTANAARAEAEAADRAKTGFLARMSHEIRTPLNGLIGILRLLAADQTGKPEQQRVETALKSATDLMDLTNDILLYSSNQDPSVQSNPEDFSLRELTDQLGQQLAALAAPKGLDTMVDIKEPAPAALHGSLVRIRQVLGNLISNAVKYTENGQVSLIVDHAPDPETGQHRVSFAVSDTGIGMGRETLDKVFDTYARSPDAYRAGIEGTGLGLAIARQLTDALGGTLKVESQPGVGSTFALTVPLQSGDPAKIAKPDAPLRPRATPLNVLSIEDHPVNQLVLRGYLERLGCTVTEAANGAQGLRVAQKQRFDLILIDLDLPDMDGAEVAAQLRANGDRGVRVALTAHLRDDTAQERHSLGCARILQKPISPRALTEVLDVVANLNRDQDESTKLRDQLQEDIADLGPDVTRQAIDELIADIPATLARLAQAAPEGRRKAAHRLRGAASNYGLETLCAALARIEATPDDPDGDLLRRASAAGDAAVRMLNAAGNSAGLQPTDAGSTN